ncbi:hypothetical protein BH11PSE3_BH11PSE3_32510 [soil metagenome]
MLDGRAALQTEKPRKPRSRRALGYGLMDVFVIATCSVAFAVVLGAGRHGEPPPPPVDLIAHDLGMTSEQFQQTANRLMPPFPQGPPTEAQKQRFAMALDVSVERLESVMDKYRPDRLRAH